jgi:type IV pilus assembly protein PilN
MLSAINGVVPGGIWFTEIAFDSPTTLVIKGDAVNDQVIVNLVDRLQALPMLAQASLNTMTTTPQAASRKSAGGYKHFEVRCVLKLNTTPADLTKSAPKRI